MPEPLDVDLPGSPKSELVRLKNVNVLGLKGPENSDQNLRATSRSTPLAERGLRKFSSVMLSNSLYIPIPQVTRRRKRTHARKPVQKYACDFDTVVRPLQTDWVCMQRRRKVACICVVAALLQISLVFAQVLGILLPGAEYLAGPGHSRRTVRYHAIVIAQSLLVAVQVITIVRWYKLRMRTVAYFDHLWRDTPLQHSHLLWPCLGEVFILLLHEPPYFVYLWRDSYKLQLGALCRAYLLFELISGWSANASQGGRLATSVARVSNSKLFQLRTWMYLYPMRLVSTVLMGGWLVLSTALYIAEEGGLTLDESMWLTFITMATVGYGDYYPRLQAGKAVSCLTALHGMVMSALLINAISNLLKLSPDQGNVVEFLTEARMSGDLCDIAVRIVQHAFKHAMLKKQGGKGCILKLKHLCSKFRRLRRERDKFVNGMQSNVDVPSTVQRMEDDIIEIKRHLLIQPRSEYASPLTSGSLSPITHTLQPLEQVNLSGTVVSITKALSHLSAKHALLAVRQDDLDDKIDRLLSQQGEVLKRLEGLGRMHSP
ncbi:Small conductance calcium-activated potassium channel-like protein 3 [Diplonema papillatum]|nr:Small conductance calcium-activated potassium channel-like protein 3 [Diplonema papillatum]